MDSQPKSLEEAVEEFVERRQRGESIGSAEFAASFPEFAGELIPALDAFLALEQVRPSERSSVPERIGVFRILCELGRGGMGVVYEAVEEPLGRRVALKVLPPEYLTSSSARARFQREAEIAARLDHPGIATLYGAGLQDGEPWIAMRLVEGEPLSKSITRARERGERCIRIGERSLGGRDATLAVAECFGRLARALQAAHELGVVHRDVKPSNLVVASDGTPVLLDFGLAIDPESDGRSLTGTGETAGTPAYLPPESVAGEVARSDAQGDVYALGVSLYECLSVHRAFDAPTRAGLYHAILSGSPTGVRSLNRDIPRDLSVVVATAMERDRARRYRSAAALAEDLEACVAGRPVAARPVPPLGRLARWARREPRLAATTFAAVSIGIVGFVWVSVANARLTREKLRAESNAETARHRSEDVLSLSAIQDLHELSARADELWPAIQDNVPKYEAWLSDARTLVEGRVADLKHATKAKPGLAEHRRKLFELRARALPQSEADKQSDRETHPKRAELERWQAQCDWMLRMLGRAPPSSDSAAGSKFGNDAMPSTVAGLCDEAFAMTSGPERRYGEESRALAFARRAVELAAAAEKPTAHIALALALFVNGRTEEAKAAAQEAFDESNVEQREWVVEAMQGIDEQVKRWATPEARTERERELESMKARVAELEKEVSERRTWTFANAEDRWWHAQLERLVDDLDAFTDPKTGLFSKGTSKEHGWGVEKRLAEAQILDDLSVRGPHAAAAWKQATAAVTRSAEYGGLSLSPQLGLLPIGQDPESHLFEFAHVQSGEIAERGPDGRISVHEKTGMVFVLIPGGSFDMGAQAKDPHAVNYDTSAMDDEAPVASISITPFFLSKYEMTQSQWLRITGRNPSHYPPGSKWGENTCTLACPIEQVNWDEFTETLPRIGLRIPTEAQWEYAARAGTHTPWWSGAARESVEGTANIADRTRKENLGPATFRYDDWLVDGWSLHAPVGTYRANPWGLHDVVGNVFELCRDNYGEYGNPATPGTGERHPIDAHIRPIRGGAFNFNAMECRSSLRFQAAPDFKSYDVGVRPARDVVGN